jgi:F0F1-type ATP synthase assembly protein I
MRGVSTGALISVSSSGRTVLGVSLVVKALLSLAITCGAVVAMASLGGTFAAVAGGLVVLIALLVFIRAIIGFAGEPGEKPPR